MSGKHTQTTWSVVASQGGGEEWEVVIPFPELPGEYLWIATCSGMGHDYGNPHANAAFIVKAVNSHDALVEALREANAFILAPAEDIKEGVLSRIRSALSETATPIRGEL